MIRRINGMDIRLPFRFLLIVSILGIGIAQTSTPVNVNLIVNCFGRCGEDSQLPCSCHPKCFVYKNCCEGIYYNCPHLVDSAIELYGHLVDAQVVCEINSITMISSCPHSYKKRSATPAPPRLEVRKYSVENAMIISFDTSKSVLDTKASKISDEKLQSGMKRDGSKQLASGNPEVSGKSFRGRRDAAKSSVVLDAVRNAPVYDSLTGFVYRNASLFYCNGGLQEHFVPWLTMFRLSSRDNVTDIADFDRYLTKREPVYKEPKGILGSEIGLPCYSSELTTTCDTQVAIRNPNYVFECDSFTSYVYNAADDGKKYRNRFCFYCDSERGENFVPIFRIPRSFDFSYTNFSLVMSLNTDNKVNIEVHSVRNPDKQLRAESSCKLNLEENTEEGTQLQDREDQCQVKICDTGFQVRPNGQCKALHKTYIAFDLGEYPLASPEQESQVSQFLTCGMNTYLDIEISEINAPIIIHDESNKTMYVANMSTFLPELTSLSPTNSDFVNNSIGLLTLLKAFKEFRKPESGSFCSFDFERITTLSFQNVTVLNATAFHSSELRFVDYSYVRDRNLSGRVLNNDSTTLCLASSPVSPGSADRNSVKTLLCIDEPLYESDLKQVLEMCNSSCFSVFNGDVQAEKRNQSIVSFNWGQSVISSVTLTFLTSFFVAVVMILLPTRG